LGGLDEGSQILGKAEASKAGPGVLDVRVGKQRVVEVGLGLDDAAALATKRARQKAVKQKPVRRMPALLPPSALRESCHRGLARNRSAMRALRSAARSSARSALISA
jgi:hypothetical protein